MFKPKDIAGNAEEEEHWRKFSETALPLDVFVTRGNISECFVHALDKVHNCLSTGKGRYILVYAKLFLVLSHACLKHGKDVAKL